MISMNDYQTVENVGHIRCLVEFLNLGFQEIEKRKKQVF